MVKTWLSLRHTAGLALGLGLLVGASDAWGAQGKGNARISGVVLSAADLAPMAGVRVLLAGTMHETATDTNGIFAFKDLPKGTYHLVALVPGADTARTTLAVESRDRLEVEIRVGARLGMVLPEVEVIAPEGSGRPDFERRRREGAGRYLTREFIESRDPPDLMELMRHVPGARVTCRNGRNCALRFARHPIGCGPAYFLDGIPSHPYILFLTPPREVAGVEVYTGPAETPPEFEGAGSRCGAVVIWTRLGRKPT